MFTSTYSYKFNRTLRLKIYFTFLLSLSFYYNQVFSQNKTSSSVAKDNRTNFFPATSLENPLSSGKFGTISFGATMQNKTRIANQPDANVGVYIGLGEPEKFIGLGTTVNIYGLSNELGEHNNLGQGSLSFHLSRFLLHNKLLFETGLDNAIFWGGDNQSYISYQRSCYFSANYIVYSSAEDIQKSFSYLSITAGMGNGYFRRDENYTKGTSGYFDPFFSLATPIFKGTNIIAEWNGYDIGAGFSSIPFQKIPFMFTAEITDLIFGNPRIAVSVSFPFNLRSRRKASQTGVRPIGTKLFRAVRTI